MNKDIIIDGLNKIKKLDPTFSNFGAKSHKYSFNPVLEYSTIEKAEERYKCNFPDDYKEFITKIGNGGAGPGYGLFPFGFEDDNFDFCTWEEGFLTDDLSLPFIHKTAWNIPVEIVNKKPKEEDFDTEEEFEEKDEEYYNSLDKIKYESNLMNGAIPICHYGCCIRAWLVITGKMKGTVWIDNRTDGKGICPSLSNNGKYETFTEWYLNWLDETLIKLSKPLRIIKKL